jgi:hypothetical protein
MFFNIIESKASIGTRYNTNHYLYQAIPDEKLKLKEQQTNWESSASGSH